MYKVISGSKYRMFVSHKSAMKHFVKQILNLQPAKLVKIKLPIPHITIKWS